MLSMSFFCSELLDKIREDMCGFEEYTHAPEIAQFRPTPPSRLPTTTPEYDIVGGGLNTEGAIILGGTQILVLQFRPFVKMHL